MSNAPTKEQQEQALQRYQLEMQQKMAQDLMQSMGEQCSTKCITKSGESLSDSEKRCIANCMDRYMEAMGIVGQVIQQKGGQ